MNRYTLFDYLDQHFKVLSRLVMVMVVVDTLHP